MTDETKPTWLHATADGVEITLDGQTVTLQYTLKASKKINGSFNGFTGAFQRLFSFDADAYAIVVAAGLGKEVRDVENDVFLAGYDTLAKPLSEYVAWLSNGGKAPAPVNQDVPGNV